MACFLRNFARLCLIGEDIVSRSRISIIGIICAGLGLSNPAVAQSDILAALSTAQPGDVIELSAGDYGLLEISGYAFSTPVTLRFHEEAVVEQLRLRYVTGLHFENLEVKVGVAENPSKENAVYIFGGGDLSFRKSRLAWSEDDDPLNDGTLVVADGVDGLSVEATHFSDGRNGVIVRSSNNVRITGSHFTEIASDAIVISGSSDVVVDQNLCADFRSVSIPGAHPDCIQLQSGSRGVANDNVRIKNNTILQADGDKFQPIFISSRHVSAPNTTILVEGNLIRQSTAIGIHIGNTNDLIVRGNRVYPSLQSEISPRILVRAPGSNVLIEDNIAASVKGPEGAIIQNNTTP